MKKYVKDADGQGCSCHKYQTLQKSTGKSFSYRMLSLVLKLVIKKENTTYKFPK